MPISGTTIQQQRRPVAEDAAADPRRRSRRCRAGRPARARATLNRTIAGSAGTSVGPPIAADRREERGPAVPTSVARQRAVAEQPAAAVVPELVAALVVEPAVVAHRRARGRASTSHCTAIAGASSTTGRTFSSHARTRGSVPQARRPASYATPASLAAVPAGGGSGTRRSSARARRGAPCARGSRRAARRGRRRAAGAAGRSASSRPRRSRRRSRSARAISSASSRIEISSPVPRFTGSGPS